MNQREASKQNWRLFSSNNIPTVEEINAGSLQRIADATELMASKYIQMEIDLSWYKKHFGERGDELKKRDKLISSLRGVITRMKNKSLKQF